LSQFASTLAATPSALDSAAFDTAERQWTANGYAILERRLSPEPCAALGANILAEYDRFAGAQPRGLGGRLSGHLNCFPGSGVRALVQRAQDAGLTALASQLYGEPLELEHVGCNCNLPGSHYQTFHIDCAWSRPCVIVNVILVETSFVNGAIELVAGVDAAPLPYWKFAASGRARRGVRHTMQPGDVLIRSSRVWHRGAPNRSDRMRPMLALTYWPACERRAAFDYDQHGGEITFLPNRFSADLPGKAREFVEARMPWLSSALSFTGSLARRP
jgi:hypothetical protein